MFLWRYLLALAIMTAFDLVWLGVVAKKFYQTYLGPRRLDRPKIIPAVIFYLIYGLAVVVLVLDPALATNNWRGLIARAALLGLAAYAAYDLSNLATLKKWSTKLAVVDMVWGACLTIAASSLVFWIFK